MEKTLSLDKTFVDKLFNKLDKVSNDLSTVSKSIALLEQKQDSILNEAKKLQTDVDALKQQMVAIDRKIDIETRRLDTHILKEVQQVDFKIGDLSTQVKLLEARQINFEHIEKEKERRAAEHSKEIKTVQLQHKNELESQQKKRFGIWGLVIAVVNICSAFAIKILF